MKARYKDFVNKQQRDVYNRKADEMQKAFAVLWEKLFLYTMHTQFGIGETRLKRWIEAMADNVDEMHSDPIFWDRVDKDVIDNMHFDYPRCDREYMEKAFYKPPEISAEEKRAAVAEFRKMQEFLSREEQPCSTRIGTNSVMND